MCCDGEPTQIRLISRSYDTETKLQSKFINKTCGKQKNSRTNMNMAYIDNSDIARVVVVNRHESGPKYNKTNTLTIKEIEKKKKKTASQPQINVNLTNDFSL